MLLEIQTEVEFLHQQVGQRIEIEAEGVAVGCCLALGLVAWERVVTMENLRCEATVAVS